jgi:ATP synthase protein I
MSEEPPSDPLARLGEKIDRAQRERLGSQRSRGRTAGPPGGLGLGMRMATEMAAALIVGLALGWLFDRLLGTRPWGLIGFFFLGAAAGMVNVFRAAMGVGYGPAPPPGRNTGRDPAHDDDRSGPR